MIGEVLVQHDETLAIPVVLGQVQVKLLRWSAFAGG